MRTFAKLSAKIARWWATELDTVRNTALDLAIIRGAKSRSQFVGNLIESSVSIVC